MLPDRTPVIGWWAAGEGRVIYSGALDAWRFRGRADDAFARFWTKTIAAAALAAPARIQLTLAPSVVRTGERARLTARLRCSEWDESGRDVRLPAVSADVVAPGGHREMIRMWPTSEACVFEGEVASLRSGLHDVRVATSAGASADAALVVDDGARSVRHAADVLEALPQLTGGVTVDGADVSAVIGHLDRSPSPPQRATMHLFRSAWCMIPFAAALCIEWLVRRRRGLR